LFESLTSGSSPLTGGFFVPLNQQPSSLLKQVCTKTVCNKKAPYTRPGLFKVLFSISLLNNYLAGNQLFIGLNSYKVNAFA
jgi:hypothetical protein